MQFLPTYVQVTVFASCLGSSYLGMCPCFSAVWLLGALALGLRTSCAAVATLCMHIVSLVHGAAREEVTDKPQHFLGEAAGAMSVRRSPPELTMSAGGPSSATVTGVHMVLGIPIYN